MSMHGDLKRKEETKETAYWRQWFLLKYYLVDNAAQDYLEPHALTTKNSMHFYINTPFSIAAEAAKLCK